MLINISLYTTAFFAIRRDGFNTVLTAFPFFLSVDFSLRTLTDRPLVNVAEHSSSDIVLRALRNFTNAIVSASAKG